jgi:alkylation response protein AidB-like acyl-CoA dehydrogenase
MIELLSREQRERYEEFSLFVQNQVQPFAPDWENNQGVSREAVEKCAEMGYLGCTMPEDYQGNGWDIVTYGIFTAALTKSSASLGALFNVHTMVMQTLLKWGTEEQKNRWLTRMCRGEILGAFALTEPEAGSDIQSIQTRFLLRDDEVVINGRKKWITFGGWADLFLVFGRDEENGKPTAILVEKTCPGLVVSPITSMLGFKGSYLAVLEFHDCVVRKENLIAKPGFAFTHIAPYALDYGRVSVSFTALGILKGCLEYCCTHVLSRKTFHAKLIEQSTIKEMITTMGIDYEAACHLCLNACHARQAQDPEAAEKVMIAKYFTTRAASRHANNAVQIHGAAGCNENYPIARYYRDSKILEIIEGSNQVHEMVLGNSFARKYRIRN